MKLNTNFELIEVADEHMAVPVGESAVAFSGVVFLSNSAFLLLQHMKQPRDEDDLAEFLVSTFGIDKKTAKTDVDEFIKSVTDMGLIE